MNRATTPIEIIRDQVVNLGFCVGCGACAGGLTNSLRMEYTEGRFLPEFQADSTIHPDTAIVCPFSDTSSNEDAIAQSLFSTASLSYDQRIGYYHATGAAYVNDEELRIPSSSGGITTWLLKKLLSESIVDAVIHVKQGPHGDTKTLFSYSLSHNSEEIADGCSSRYYPVSMDVVLKQVRETNLRYAFVGLPCFVKAIRNLCEVDEKLKDRLKVMIGLVCGHLKTAGFAESFSAQLGVHHDAISTVNFREKLENQPASSYGFSVTAKDEQFPSVTKRSPSNKLFGSDWGHSFFKLRSCDFCDDIFAETADVVIGDAWLKEFSADWRGTSIVLTRSPVVQKLLNQGIEGNEVTFLPLQPDQMVSSQRANFAHRREGLPYRIAECDAREEWHPRKRYEKITIPLSSDRQKTLKLREEVAALSSEAWRIARKLSTAEEIYSAFQAMVMPKVAELQYFTQLSSLALSSQVKIAGVSIPREAAFSWILRIAIKIRSIRSLMHIWHVEERKSVMLLPPTSPGSLGDEAVITATVQSLRNKGIKNFYFMSYSPDDDWSIYGDNIKAFNIGPFLGYRSPRVALKLALICRYISHFYVCGTDVLDGHHNSLRSLGRLALADIVARMGVPVTVLGFSFSEDADLAARYAIQQVDPRVVFLARDPISYEVLLKTLPAKPELVSDPAFLMKPHFSPRVIEIYKNWIDCMHSEGRIILGFNANHFLARYGEEKLIDVFYNVISRVCELYPEIALCFIPHDVRGNPSDVDLAESLHSRVAMLIGEHRVITTPGDFSAAEIKAVASMVDVIFSGKMHLSIAGLGSGTPVGCITYKDNKFLGLFSHFEITEWLLPEETWNNELLLTEFISSLIKDRKLLKTKIESKLEDVMNLSALNFQVRSSRIAD